MFSEPRGKLVPYPQKNKSKDAPMGGARSAAASLPVGSQGGLIGMPVRPHAPDRCVNRGQRIRLLSVVSPTSCRAAAPTRYCAIQARVPSPVFN